MQDAIDHPPTILLIAGEPSGDALGARLMGELSTFTEGRAVFVGVGGPLMEGQGLRSLFPMADLSVMGLAEVLPRLVNISRRVRETAAFALRVRPHIIVTIDSPSFSFRVAARLSDSRIPLIHYVAPQVWAWKPWRAARIARHYDHLLALLPFEPFYFTSVGLPTTFVGHPVLESGAGNGTATAFYQRHGVPSGATIVTVLLGSRDSEVSRLAEPFAATLGLLKQRFPGLHAAVPVVPHLAMRVREVIKSWPVPTVLVEGEASKWDAFAASQAALAASGTVTLELALARLPHVIAYRLNPLTAAVARYMIRVRYANLINLIVGHLVVPEFLQGDCEPQRMAAWVAGLMLDEGVRRAQIEDFGVAVTALRSGREPASRRAASIVLAHVKTSARM